MPFHQGRFWFARHYSVFCALKYVYRRCFSSVVLFTDSLHAMYHLRDGLFSSRTSLYVYKILYIVSLIQERDCSAGLAWIPSHSGIVGGEQTNSVTTSTSRLPFVVHCGVPLANLFSVLDCDFRFWCGSLSPYVGSAVNRSRYFDRVTFNTPRPWFMGCSFPRGYVSSVRRLSSAHICTGSHFSKMGWDLDVGCGCGAEMKDLAHLINECPILSEGRPRLFRFLAVRFPGGPPEHTDLGNLIFPPDQIRFFSELALH